MQNDEMLCNSATYAVEKPALMCVMLAMITYIAATFGWHKTLASCLHVSTSFLNLDQKVGNKKFTVG